MTLSLRQQVMEDHPFTPRVEKLKLIKFLPIAYDKIQELTLLNGSPPLTPFSTKHSTIENDYLIINDEKQKTIGKYYVGDDPALLGTIILPGNKIVSEHQYHLITNKSQFCGCSECSGSDRADELSRFFEERALIVNVPREEKISSPSPETAERLHIPVTPPIPVITKITKPNGTSTVC